MTEQLYINTDVLGDETYIGTWAEWLRKLEPSFDNGYREYRRAAVEAQQQARRHPELVDELPAILSREEWIQGVLEECLVPADEHSGKYKRLYK